MTFNIVFIKKGKGDITSRPIYDYLKDIAPLEFTNNVTEAVTCKYDDTLDIKDFARTIGLILEDYAGEAHDLDLDIAVLNPADNSSYAFLEIGKLGKLYLNSRKSAPTDIIDTIKLLTIELSSYIADILLDVTLYKTMRSPMMGSSKSLGTAVTEDLDKLTLEKATEFIQQKTKGTLSKPKETLDDYVCEDLLKDELLEIVDFFNNYEEYSKNGIVLPTGILFKGLPGTGKTYAARCIAGTADCLFISCTASALQGQYIGSGAQNIRDLFNAAKELKDKLHQGVIIFIDELDSLGSRENRGGNSSGEEDRTLNQLLAEMSGFEDCERIMVLGATNYPGRIDDALLRSGRFSRQINIEYPNETERLHLVKHYFNKLKFKFETDLNEMVITELTEGLSPADIKELSNEVGIMTIRQKLSNITLANVNEAIDKIITKNIKSPDSPKMDYTLIAAHESGHVLAEYLYCKSIPIKVTNYSYGSAGGFTQSTFRLEGILNEDKFIAEIKILLGGRAAEKVYCGIITNGASNDLDKAKAIMKRYYESYLFEKYDISKLDQIVQDKILELYEQVCNDFAQPENYTILKELTDNLSKERVLYKRDITPICGKCSVEEIL